MWIIQKAQANRNNNFIKSIENLTDCVMYVCVLMSKINYTLLKLKARIRAKKTQKWKRVVRVNNGITEKTRREEWEENERGKKGKNERLKTRWRFIFGHKTNGLVHIIWLQIAFISFAHVLLYGRKSVRFHLSMFSLHLPVYFLSFWLSFIPSLIMSGMSLFIFCWCL